MREFTGYHVSKGYHHNSALDLDHNSVKVNNQQAALIFSYNNPPPFCYIRSQNLSMPCLYGTTKYCNGRIAGSLILWIPLYALLQIIAD